MNWTYKAYLQLLLSHVPGGESLNYFLQRFVKRSLPVGSNSFIKTVAYAKDHINALSRYMRIPLSDATFFEFGAGWDMIVPLSFYAFGVQKQIIIDIKKLIRPWLVNESIKKLKEYGHLFDLSRYPLSYIDYGEIKTELAKHYGIEYRAPCDARNTGLEIETLDCITSTNTLEHIPVQDLKLIIGECHKILRKDGVVSFRIDYQDHYSYFDKNISAYNFLQFSDREWAFYNPSLQYQNRLRHVDYMRLFKEGGFEILEIQSNEGTEHDFEILNKLKLYQNFRHYSLSELAIHDSLIILRKKTFR